MVHRIGYVRRDFLSFIKSMADNIFYTYSILYFGKVRLVFLFIVKKYLRFFFNILRYNSFCMGVTSSDISGYERHDFLLTNQLNLTVLYIFYLPWWGSRLCIFSISDLSAVISGGSAFFSGVSWPEREASEMLGLFFLNK